MNKNNARVRRRRRIRRRIMIELGKAKKLMNGVHERRVIRRIDERRERESVCVEKVKVERVSWRVKKRVSVGYYFCGEESQDKERRNHS